MLAVLALVMKKTNKNKIGPKKATSTGSSEKGLQTTDKDEKPGPEKATSAGSSEKEPLPLKNGFKNLDNASKKLNNC